MNALQSHRILAPIAALILMCWLPIAFPAGILASGFGARAQAKAASMPSCHCLMCASGKMCCCLAKAGANRMCCMRSTCDAPIAMPTSVVLPKVLPGSAFRVADAPVRVSLLISVPARVDVLTSRAPAPLSHPPSLS